jgi:hypothetical protein
MTLKPLPFAKPKAPYDPKTFTFLHHPKAPYNPETLPFYITQNPKTLPF